MLSWQNILNSRQIVANIERKKKLANQGEVLCTLGGISPIDLSLSSNGNHGHIISEKHWKSTFNFTEIVNKYGLKGGTVCQIVRFISQFYLKLYMLGCLSIFNMLESIDKQLRVNYCLVQSEASKRGVVSAWINSTCKWQCSRYERKRKRFDNDCHYTYKDGIIGQANKESVIDKPLSENRWP